MLGGESMSERGKGTPLDILMRIRRHYGCSMIEAKRIFEKKGYAAVPERGTGLKTGRARR